MGMEYRLEPSSGEGVAWAASLEDLLGTVPAMGELLEWRRSEARGLPDAFVRIAPEDLWFCANTAEGEALLARVHRILQREFGMTDLTEL